MPDPATYSLTLPHASSGAPQPATKLRLWAIVAGAALVVSSVVVAASAERGRAPQPARTLGESAVQDFGGIPEFPLDETSSVAFEAPAVAVEAPAVLTEAPSVEIDAPVPAVMPSVTLPPPEVAGARSAALADTAPPLRPPVPPPAAAAPGARWVGEGFVFVIEGQEWDADSFTSVDAALSALSPRVRSQLANRSLGPVNILVNRSGRSLSGKQPYGGAANYFSTNDGKNELVLFPAQSVQTILHELGHAYNLRGTGAGRYATVFLDPEMQSFMAATGWRVLSTPEQIRSARDHLQVQVAYDGAQLWSRVSNNDPLEDFANSFALYFLAPDDLRARSAERFTWFETRVGR